MKKIGNCWMGFRDQEGDTIVFWDEENCRITIRTDACTTIIELKNLPDDFSVIPKEFPEKVFFRDYNTSKEISNCFGGCVASRDWEHGLFVYMEKDSGLLFPFSWSVKLKIQSIAE